MNLLFLDIAAAVQVKGQELNKTSYKMVTFTFEYVRMYVLHIAKLFSSFSADLSILSSHLFKMIKVYHLPYTHPNYGFFEAFLHVEE